VSAPVSIAVVSWNTRELLGACLRSMQPEHEAGRAEIWVVDNASSDGSAEMVRAEFAWVSLIASEENLGFGPAVNLIAERSSGPWLAAANADVELTPGALDALIEAGRRDPAAAIIAPRLVLRDGRTQHSVHPFPKMSTSLLLNLSVERLSSTLADRLCVIGHWDESRRRRVDWAHGACLLVRRSAFEAVGGFDPKQWLYAEDIDLAWRLRREGWATRYEPTATVRHAVSASTTQAWGDERAQRSMAASYTWILRRRGRLAAWSVAAINAGGAAARVLGFEVLARLSSSTAPRQESDRWRWHMRLHRSSLRVTRI